MSLAIKVENLSKAYQIGQIGTGTISRDLERWWITKVLRKEDPFQKIGETNDRRIKGESNVIWSLKDINFEIQQGEAVGIIGNNGAGKSTLLKLLSRITTPTNGKIKLKGRIASLLEVGTGFRPELTGRENIYLNGCILGMRSKEITRKLDEIIDFSGVERYLDTPVKRYSTGMQMRLAFGVAVNLESEILVVDEVLAVGDLEFQKKCLDKMESIKNKEGRTVLFVSHNLNNIRQLCQVGILLYNGNLQLSGSIDSVLSEYAKLNSKSASTNSVKEVNLEKRHIFTGDKLKISFLFREEFDSTNKKFLIKIRDHRNLNIMRFEIKFPDKKSKKLVIETEPLNLTQGDFYIDIGIKDFVSNDWVEQFTEVSQFTIGGLDTYNLNKIYTNRMALIIPKYDCYFSD